MEIYNYFEYGKIFVICLKFIVYIFEKFRFFIVFGFEDLYNFNDKLLFVFGMILIVVDGCEFELKWNEFDVFNNNDMFFFIVV